MACAASHSRTAARDLRLGRSRASRQSRATRRVRRQWWRQRIRAAGLLPGRERQTWLRIGPARLPEGMTRAGKRVALPVHEALDFERQFHVAPSIETLAGATLVWLELGKLSFPETQHVGFNFANTGYVPNFEVEAVGDRGRFLDALPGELRGHSVVEGVANCAAEALL